MSAQAPIGARDCYQRAHLLSRLTEALDSPEYVVDFVRREALRVNGREPSLFEFSFFTAGWRSGLNRCWDICEELDASGLKKAARIARRVARA